METHLCWSLFLIMLQVWRPETLLKRDPNKGVFLWKFLILFISKSICERLLFDFFNGSLLHGPKGSRSRLYDGVRLQGLRHKSSFLFLSWHEPSPSPPPTCVRKSKTNTFDESIKFLYWLFLVVLDGFRSF